MALNGKIGVLTRFIGPLRTASYQSSHANYVVGYHQGTMDYLTVMDIEEMLRDPQVQFGNQILRAPIYGARWQIRCDDQRAAEWLDDTLARFWEVDIDKALDMLIWGAAGGELAWKLNARAGLIEYDHLRDVYFTDMRPLESSGQLVGLSVHNVPDHSRCWLYKPRFFWVANNPKSGQFYGRSRLWAAKMPWAEKRGRKGAVDTRRLWFFKNAFGGGIIRFPEGITVMPDGTERNNQEIAREIIEKAETGHVMGLPSTKDENGNFLWEYMPPTVNGDPAKLLEYPQALDNEILLAMGIPPEVVTAAQQGSGWSGRSVPFVVFLASEDRIVDTLLRAITDCVLIPGVEANFGKVPFQIKPVSLLPKDEQLGQTPQFGQPPGAPGPRTPEPADVMGSSPAPMSRWVDIEESYPEVW